MWCFTCSSLNCIFAVFRECQCLTEWAVMVWWPGCINYWAIKAPFSISVCAFHISINKPPPQKKTTKNSGNNSSNLWANAAVVFICTCRLSRTELVQLWRLKLQVHLNSSVFRAVSQNGPLAAIAITLTWVFISLWLFLGFPATFLDPWRFISI